MKKLHLIFFLLACGFSEVYSQENAKSLPLTPLPLTDLSAFQPTTANWKIVGNVFADRRVDQALEGFPGTGILAKVTNPKNRGKIITR